MKNLFLFLSLLASTGLRAQMVLTGQIVHANACAKVVLNVPFDNWYHRQNAVEAILSDNGEFKLDLPVQKAQTIFLDFAGTRLFLYAEPHKSLVLAANAQDFRKTLKFKGQLARENNFWVETGLTFYTLNPQTWHDSVSAPPEILTAIQKNQKRTLTKLQKYKGNSAEFKKITAADIQYFAGSKIMSLIYQNNVFSAGYTSKFPRQDWLKVLQEAYALAPLSQDQAVSSYHYKQILSFYPRYLEWSTPNKADFAKLAETVMQEPFDQVMQKVKAWGREYWEYKAFTYFLKGLALESAQASFINNLVFSGQLGYLPKAYADFTRQFPESKYRPYLAKITQPYFESRKNGNSAIVLEPNASYKNLDEILKTHRGRVVYLDIWGSWCGPCREQFAYSQTLKAYFQGQPVDFVYIAFEHRTNPEKTWQETVQFYHLTGRHILGNQVLEDYFRSLYPYNNSLRFPSYLLFDKEGKLVTKQAEQPEAGQKLYEQINKLL